MPANDRGPLRPTSRPDRAASRRDFLSGGAALGGLALTRPFWIRKTPAPLESLQIGVVGCGGRGGGACNDTLTANPDVRLVAMADIFPDKCRRLRDNLAKRHGERVAVSDQRIHAGLDGYLAVIEDPEVDLVILTTPPGFRPKHVTAAVKARKHVFAEKPVCVDPAGYRECLAAHDRAAEQGTAIVTGTQYRRQDSFVQAIEKLHEGALGEIVSMTARYCATGIWFRPRKKGMTDLEYVLNNWMHFIWLSGDQICEQAVHNIDVMSWVMGAPPIDAIGLGGRFTRPQGSEMWDSMAVDYRFPGERLGSLMCRQIPGSQADLDNVVHCQEGVAYIRAFNNGARLVDRKGRVIWETRGDIGAAYKKEHADLVRGIREGKPIVELRRTAVSSLMAVMGRLAAYTGRVVSWDFVSRQSRLDLFPADLGPDYRMPEPTYAIPGRTKLV